MEVDALGVTGRGSDLRVGQCFFFADQGATILGLLTEDHGHRATVAFSGKHHGGAPWIAGAPPYTVLIADNLVLRADPRSVTFSNDFLLGHVISAGGTHYLVVAFKAGSVTVNLRNGITEDPPLTGVTVSFSRWSVGMREGERWVPVFDFPESVAPSAARRDHDELHL